MQSVVCNCTHQLQNDEKEPSLCSQPVACVGRWISFFSLITGVDLPTLFREEVSPPSLLYLPGMQFKLCLLLDSLDLSKLPGSWPKRWRSLKRFFSLLSKNVFTFLELWLTDSFSWCCKNFPYASEFISFISKRPMVPFKPQWSEPHHSTTLLGWICPEAKQLWCGKLKRWLAGGSVMWREKYEMLSQEIWSCSISTYGLEPITQNHALGLSFPSCFQ